MTPDQAPGNGSGQPQNIATAIAEVSERMTLLIREEIELAKAEVTEKVTKLVKGAIVAIAAGIFVVTAMLFVLHGLSWLAWWEIPGSGSKYWLGYFVVAGGLLLLGVLAGFIAARALRSGAPPTPAMAIDEARKIKDTVSSSETLDAQVNVGAPGIVSPPEESR
jgi:Putative Actinobacterial Holin-X, holin superfamily III